MSSNKYVPQRQSSTPLTPIQDPLNHSSLVTRPSDTQMNVNIPYHDMILPIQGPENPFADRNRFLNQNALAGHVEEQAMSDHAFKAQHLTHSILGYSVNPSVDPNAPSVLGSLDIAHENGFATVDAIRLTNAQKKDLKRKRKNKGNPDIVDGEGAYVGPWATWEGEDQAGFLDGVEEDEGEHPEEEEEPGAPVVKKKAKPKRGGVGQETSVFHGKSMTDYQGRTYIHPPVADAPHLSAELWDVYTHGNCLRTFHGHVQAVKDVTFSNDGNGKTPYVVRFHPDDDKQHIFLAGMSDKKIIQYDMNSGEITQEYDQHLGPVNTITFVDENRRFVTTSDDKTIRAWDYDIPVVIKYIAEPHMHSMPAVTLHPSKKYFAAQSLDNQILVYSTDNFRQNRKKRFAGHSVAGYACQVGFSPDGKWISSGDSEGNVVFWDWKSGRIKSRLKAHSKVVIAHEWLPHETSKVVTASWDGLIKLWD
ncbi:WD40-repeat-containing domain protein [Chiua virens]|nr:WD40-repeat-containing domain protein [Chiua virens]